MRDRNEIIHQHTLQTSTGEGVIAISGYQFIDFDQCDCFACYGNHFHSYGIADNSLIFTCKTAPFSSGDLVLKFDDGKPQVYLYTRSKKDIPEGLPVLHSKKDVYAKILFSLNLYE